MCRCTTLTAKATAIRERGNSTFVIKRAGKPIATVPEQPKNPFGRPLFQGLQYSDTPNQPLVPMNFTDTKPAPNKTHQYRVITVNTVGLKSE